MRPLLSLKTLYRTPIRTILTFALIAAAAFALFSRVADYTIMSRELDRAGSFYRGTAILDTGIPDTSENYWRLAWLPDVTPPVLTSMQIEAFSSLPGVSSVDYRFMTAGFSDDISRYDVMSNQLLSYNSYADRFIVDITPIKVDDKDDLSILHFRLNHLLAGHPGLEIMTSINMLPWKLMLEDEPDYMFGEDFMQSLENGERYAMIGYFTGTSTMNRWLDTYYYNPQLQLPVVWSLDGYGDDYLELDEFSELRMYIDIINSASRTFDMIYTADMRSIPRFAEGLSIVTQGRLLSEEDTDACVISNELMRRYNLNIGDTITIELCDKLLEQNSEMGAMAIIPERYSTPLETVDLTIVGAYTDTDTLESRREKVHLGYSQQSIFVPSSLLPVDIPPNHAFKPGEVSFVVGNGRDISTFLEAALPLASEMGIELRFNDGGWLRVEESHDLSTNVSFISLIVFISAALTALLLSVYLFIRYSRVTYAIMRTLGTPRGKAQRSVLLPFFFLSALAIPLGGALGLTFPAQTALPVLESLAEAIPEYSIDTSVPAIVIAAFALGIAAVLILICALFMIKLGRTSPLMLLQNAAGGAKLRKSHDKSVETNMPVNSAHKPQSPAIIKGISHNTQNDAKHGYSAFRFTARHILRGIYRSKLKTGICLLLVVMVCGTMGTLTIMRDVYNDIYRNAEIKGYLTNGISDAVINALNNELITDVFYSGEYSGFGGFEYGFIADEKIAVDKLILTNDPVRFLEQAGIPDYTLHFDDASDNLLLSDKMLSVQMVIGSGLAEYLDLAIGDTINIADKYMFDEKLSEIEDYLSINTFLNHNQVYRERMTTVTANYTVAGILDCEGYEMSIFAPVGERAHKIIKTRGVGGIRLDKFSVPNIEFIVADNDNLQEAEDMLKQYTSMSATRSAYVRSVLDTAELDNAEWMTSLLGLLFPLSIAAALLIGVIATLIVINQSSREAAIMRVLGTTKLRTRTILVLEQVSLCIPGIALVIAGAALYDIDLLTRSIDALLLCCVLYMGTCALSAIVSSVLVTRRSALDLLQVKE